jgi:hypothetical protein
MSLIVITGSTLVLIGCSDGHVWWFLLPDHNHSYELFVNKTACQPKESEIILDHRNSNVSGIFPGKESCAEAAVINATSFGKFAGRIDDFVCLDLYPDVIYSACVTRSISDDRDGCDIDDNKKHGDRSGEDGSKGSNNNHHENVLLSDPSGSGEQNSKLNSKSNSGLNSQSKTESELESESKAGLGAGLPFKELSATHICIVSSGRVRITGVCRVCDIIVGDEHTLSARLFHGNNVAYNSRGKYINGTYKGATVSTGTAQPGYQYTGCYRDTVKQDKYGNYAFITVQDGVLYASILTPHRANSLSEGNTVRNTHNKNNSNNNNRSNSDSRGENNELWSDKWHSSEERAFLSQPYRLTSDCCPFIYHCTIESPQLEVEVQVERSLEEGGSERMNVPYNESTTKNAKETDINKNDDHNENDNHCKNDNVGHTERVIESRHGLNLHIVDDATGMPKTQFLPRSLHCCDSNEDDVLCVLRSMCGYDTTSTSTSTSVSTSFSAVNNSGTVEKSSGDTGYTGATGSGSLNYGTHNLTNANNNSSSMRNSTSDSMRYSDSSRHGNNDSRHSAHTDIHRITSALDRAVETEKILALEIQTVDLEILQLVSLISLIESDALSTRYFLIYFLIYFL